MNLTAKFIPLAKSFFMIMEKVFFTHNTIFYMILIKIQNKFILPGIFIFLMPGYSHLS